MKSFDSRSKMDMVFCSSKVKDMEATSWMDWWTCAAKSLAIRNKSSVAKVKHPFVMGARCQLLVVKTLPFG